MGTKDVDLSRAAWRTSSYSGGNGGQCVEVAANLPGIVAVRDSQHQAGPALVFTRAQWAVFARQLRSGSAG